jgi:TolA-binding protein
MFAALEMFRGGLRNEVLTGVQRMESQIFELVDKRTAERLAEMDARLSALEGRVKEVEERQEEDEQEEEEEQE